ncbi:hypothetical protein HanRHA438_Chr00c13g0849581 [Helianthus annuus]|nr:hypothetical protein HanRHA438_Chr00c13g0849581 [Helianthus annuus]
MMMEMINDGDGAVVRLRKNGGDRPMMEMMIGGGCGYASRRLRVGDCESDMWSEKMEDDDGGWRLRLDEGGDCDSVTRLRLGTGLRFKT